MPTGDMEKLILLHLTPDAWWTVEALRQKIADSRMELDAWPWYAYLAGFIFRAEIANTIGGVPTPVYFHNALQALERKGEITFDPREPAKGWRITKAGLIRQKLLQLEEAEKALEHAPLTD